MNKDPRQKAIEAAIRTLQPHVGAGFFEDGWGQARMAEVVDAVLALQPDPLTEEEREAARQAFHFARIHGLHGGMPNAAAAAQRVEAKLEAGASLPPRVTEEQRQAAVHEVLDFMPDPDSTGGRREVEAIVDRVLACLHPTEPEEKR